MFNEDGFSFAVGLHLPWRGGHFRMVLVFGCMVHDNKAIQSANNLKGLNGTKCCIKCKNAVNIQDQTKLEGQTYFIHYSKILPHQMDRATKQDVWNMADILELQHGKVGQAEFERMEQLFGVKHCPNGLLLDKHLRRIYNPIDHNYEDWFHAWYASSATVQFVINFHILEIAAIKDFEEHKINTAAYLDGFADKMRNSAGIKILPKDFFQKRQQAKGSPLKCFGEEAKAALLVVHYFNQIVLVPKGHLIEECRLISLFRAAQEILSSGDDAVARVNELRRLVVDIQGQLEKTYGCIRPKGHTMHHVCDNMEKMRVNLDCRPMETKHGTTKLCVQQIRNPKQVGLSAVRHMLINCIHWYETAEFTPYALIRPSPAPKEVVVLMQAIIPHLVPSSVMIARAMECPRGAVTRGALVLFSEGGGSNRLGRAELFASGRPVGEQKQHILFLTELSQKSATDWTLSTDCVAVCADFVKGLPSFVRVDAEVINLL